MYFFVTTSKVNLKKFMEINFKTKIAKVSLFNLLLFQLSKSKPIQSKTKQDCYKHIHSPRKYCATDETQTKLNMKSYEQEETERRINEWNGAK
jgi:hypothetical protein